MFVWKNARLRLGGFAVLAIILVSGAFVPTASAEIPDSSGFLRSCFLNLTGVMRMINSASQSCNFLETPVGWVQDPGGRVYGNGLEYSYAVTAKHIVVTIPNFGQVLANPVTCEPETGPAELSFKNTTAGPLHVSANHQYQELASGEEVGFTQTQPLMVYNSTAAPAGPLTISGFGAFKENSEVDCIAVVSALVKR